MEGFPLLNQKQLSEGRQFGNKCCFTLQIVFTIYTTELNTVCLHKHNACAFLHAKAFFCFCFCFVCISPTVTQEIISTTFTQTLRSLSGLYFLE